MSGVYSSTSRCHDGASGCRRKRSSRLMEVVGIPEFRAATQVRLLSESNAARVNHFAKTPSPEGAQPNSHSVDREWSLIGGRTLSLSSVPGGPALKTGGQAKKNFERYLDDQAGSSAAGHYWPNSPVST